MILRKTSKAPRMSRESSLVQPEGFEFVAAESVSEMAELARLKSTKTFGSLSRRLSRRAIIGVTDPGLSVWWLLPLSRQPTVVTEAS